MAETEIVFSPLSKMTQALSYSIEYDCFRAATYRLFCVQPKMNLRVANNTAGNLLVTYLYKKDDVVRSMKEMVKRLWGDGMVKGKSFSLDERSAREVVLLYANSDVVLRQWNGIGDDYFSFFLLPRNGYLQVQNSTVGEPSWAESNKEGLRILFDRSDLDESNVADHLHSLVQKVARKKYGFSLSGSPVC